MQLAAKGCYVRIPSWPQGCVADAVAAAAAVVDLLLHVKKDRSGLDRNCPHGC